MKVVNRVPDLAAAKFGGKENINLSQIQKDTRLTYSTVSRWVKGQVDRVDFPVLGTWCDYFDVQPGDILVYIKEE